ncbi:larval cuticle protein A2B-like [Bactrocera oleae]|uniref:larval cuticle protein A2B-like n=1 Tax=Bactrocera oleae TaxID=104688 RepID=UPI00387EAAD0
MGSTVEFGFYQYSVALAATAFMQSVPDRIQTYSKYHYNYDVADSPIGDVKSQHDVLDGSVRTVEYTADDYNDFNTIVSKSAPTIHHAAPVSKWPLRITLPPLQLYYWLRSRTMLLPPLTVMPCTKRTHMPHINMDN